MTVRLGDQHTLALAGNARAPLAVAIEQHLQGAPRTARGAAGATLGAALSLALLPFAAADAATLVVNSVDTTIAVDAACTLPEAVQNANDNAATNVDCAAGDGLDSIVFDGALAGSTVTLASPLLVSDPLSIDAAAAAGLALDGDNVTRLLRADADLSVAHLNLLNGGGIGVFEGGAIVAYGTLSVDNCVFASNRAKYEGGAISARGDLTVTNSTFDNNRAYGPGSAAGGGAIAAHGLLTVSGSTFGENETTGTGGAIRAHTQASIETSSFADNSADSGGAVFMGNIGSPYQRGVPQAQQLTITNSQFDGNRAYGSYQGDANYGGAVAFVPGQYNAGLQHLASISGSQFTDNRALPYSGGQYLQKPSFERGGKYVSVGGAVAVAQQAFQEPPVNRGPTADQVAVQLQGNTFTGNFALIGGGAALLASSVTVDSSDFLGNAAFMGGGMASLTTAPKYTQAASDSTLVINNSTFAQNGAAIGGGLMATAGTIASSGLVAQDNRAGVPEQTPVRGAGFPEFECGYEGKYGGALLLAVDSMDVQAPTITGNCAGRGAGLALSFGPYATGSVTGATVTGNSGIGQGGVLIGARYGAVAQFEGTVSGNQAGYYGSAGIAVYGDTDSSVTVARSSVTNNTSQGEGGGLTIDSLGSVVVSDSTFAGNSASSGAGVRLGQIALGQTTRAVLLPGTRDARGPALGSVLMENVTIHGNDTILPVPVRGAGATPPGSGAGIVLDADTALTLHFATVTGNSAAGDGGGLWVDPAATATLVSSIVAQNLAEGAGNDILGTVDADFTLVGDATGATINGADNIVGEDPLLGPLADNGGPTQTRAPQPDSPVLDSGTATTPMPAFDQRGAGYDRVVGAAPDMGAFEWAGVDPVPQVVSIDITPSAFAEGSAAVLTVALDAATGADVVATVAFGGVAVLDVDFSAADDDAAAGVQVLVPAGSINGSIALDAIVDGIDEPDEAFTATVTDAIGADLAGPLVANSTILDIDAAPMPMVSLSLSQATVLEEGGSTQVTVTLSEASPVDVVVTLGYSGSALLGTDYTAPAQIVIPAGQLSGSAMITALDDALEEGNESIVVDITAVGNGLEDGVQQVTATIDDSADAAGTGGPGPVGAVVIPTLSEWMLMLLGLLLPATVIGRLRRNQPQAARRA